MFRRMRISTHIAHLTIQGSQNKLPKHIGNLVVDGSHEATKPLVKSDVTPKLAAAYGVVLTSINVIDMIDTTGRIDAPSGTISTLFSVMNYAYQEVKRNPFEFIKSDQDRYIWEQLESAVERELGEA